MGAFETPKTHPQNASLIKSHGQHESEHFKHREKRVHFLNDPTAFIVNPVYRETFEIQFMRE